MIIKWLCNKWIKHKTKNFTQIPLFMLDFNYQEYKSDKNSKSCHVYLHPELETDEFINEHCQAIADHVRNTYDLERFMKI